MVSKFKYETKRNVLIVITLIWIYIIFLYLWNIQTTYDPFYLSRLADLNSNINFFNPVFQQLPYSYSLNVALVRILGDNIISNGYIPLVQFIALFSLLAFGKILYQKFKNPYNSTYFIISIAVFLVVFLTILPYQEYFIGFALYPLFLWGFFKYTYNKSFQLPIILILIFITIHFLAIPMSAWIIEFILMYFLLIHLSKYFSNSKINSKYAISTSFVTLLFVIWFFWNAKFYSSITTNTFNLNTMIELLKNLLYSNEGLELSAFNYVNVGINPLYIWAQRISDVLIYVPIALVFVYEFSRRNIFFFMHSKMDILLISLIFPGICQFLIWGSSGSLSFSYFILIFPFLSYFYILKYFSGENRLSKFKFINFIKKNNKKIINLYLILLLLSSFGIVSSQLSNKTTALPSEPVNEVSQWYSTHVPKLSYLVTDYTTQSYFQYYLQSTNKSYVSYHLTFTSQIYSYLIGNDQNSSDIENLNYLMINNMNLNKPLIQGYPAWVVLNPWFMYIGELNQNTNMNLIYDSNFIKIYKKT